MTNNIENRPEVGLGVYIIKDGKFLMGERIGAHGAHTWAPPGGHLENGESFEECALREVAEEVGLKINNLRLIGLTNDVFSPDKHYITIAMSADYDSGEPQILEPDKCLSWQWFDLKTLPSAKFLPVENFLKSTQAENLKTELKNSKKEKVK